MFHPLREAPRLVAALVALALVAPALAEDAKPADKADKPAVAADNLKTPQQQAAYAIGFNIGSSMRAQGVELDTDALVRGLLEAVGGKDASLTQDQMQQAMMAFQTEMMAKQQRNAEISKARGEEFLAANAKKENVKTTESGLQYVITKEGTGQSPAATDTVRVHYRGSLVNGEEFDNSYKRGEPLEIEVGQVIPGWTEGLQLMKEGGKASFFIPSQLGYGPRGAGKIPGNSVLIFDVELLQVTKPDAAKN